MNANSVLDDSAIKTENVAEVGSVIYRLLQDGGCDTEARYQGERETEIF